MNNTTTSTCPCGTALQYKECCSRYHTGKLPEDALTLMRSRYSAYARKLVDYVMKTTHPDNPTYSRNSAKWRQELLQFAQNTKFMGLKIVDFVDGEKMATVTFTAFLSQAGRDVTFTEKSTFMKVGDKWLYRSGEMQKQLF